MTVVWYSSDIKALVNQLFISYVKYLDLSFLYAPYSIRSLYEATVQYFSYGPNNWLMAA